MSSLFHWNKINSLSTSCKQAFTIPNTLSSHLPGRWLKGGKTIEYNAERCVFIHTLIDQKSTRDFKKGLKVLFAYTVTDSGGRKELSTTLFSSWGWALCGWGGGLYFTLWSSRTRQALVLKVCNHIENGNSILFQEGTFILCPVRFDYGKQCNHTAGSDLWGLKLSLLTRFTVRTSMPWHLQACLAYLDYARRVFSDHCSDFLEEPLTLLQGKTAADNLPSHILLISASKSLTFLFSSSLDYCTWSLPNLNQGLHTGRPA